MYIESRTEPFGRRGVSAAVAAPEWRVVAVVVSTPSNIVSVAQQHRRGRPRDY